MDRYEITKAARLFDGFIDDLSNWYIRRSRKREFSQQLHWLLLSLSKLAAPFMPFVSEELYQKLRLKKDPESVHLCDYPKPEKRLVSKKLEERMREIRQLVAQALSKRAEAGIKVRQPLNKLQITNYKLQKEKEMLELIKDEVNVKEITFGKTLKLDTKITPELKEEGSVREIVRNVQEMRKKAGFTPKDRVTICYFGEPSLMKILEKNRKVILKETFADEIVFLAEGQNSLAASKDMEFEGGKLRLGLRKSR